MSHQICMITGANSGIGKAAAVQIAQAGYRVIIACRSPQRGEAALADIRAASGSDAVELMLVDMSLQSSIRALANHFLERYDTLDVLIQNAAIFDITQKQAEHTAEGVETLWATNHLGPVLLTDLLLDALKKSKQGRVLTVSSKGLLAKPFLKVDLKDPEFRDKKFNLTNAYYQSKRAQVMYTYWLAEALKDTAITVNSIRVPAVRIDPSKYPNLSSFMKWLLTIKTRSAMTPEEMAHTYTYLATSPEVAETTGRYFDEKRREVKSSKYTYLPENIEQVMALTMGYFSPEADALD